MMLHHVVYGQPGAPAVVFLNGMTQSTSHWRSHGRAFADDFHVVTYDARGQGQTPAGDAPLTLELHAADLAALLDSVGAQTAHLVGFSHGARIALQFANSFPDRVDKLVLVSATAKPTPRASMIIRSWHEVLRLGGLEALAWASLPSILGSRFLDQGERILAGTIKATVDRNDAEGIGRLLQSMVDYPSLADLAANVKAPTLVLSADEDLLVDRAGAEELARLCGGSHREFIGCGHTLPIEQPTEFREVVRQFLS